MGAGGKAESKGGCGGWQPAEETAVQRERSRRGAGEHGWRARLGGGVRSARVGEDVAAWPELGGAVGFGDVDERHEDVEAVARVLHLLIPMSPLEQVATVHVELLVCGTRLSDDGALEEVHVVVAQRLAQEWRPRRGAEHPLRECSLRLRQLHVVPLQERGAEGRGAR
jgi:hypothetical protein